MMITRIVNQVFCPALIAAILAIAGCSGASGIELQSPIKKAPPPPITNQQALTISPDQAKTVFISASAGDRLAGSFSVQGGSGNDVNFLIKDPSGNTVVNGGRVSNNWQFDFVCASTGSFQIVFDNSFSVISNKAINLTTTLYPSK